MKHLAPKAEPAKEKTQKSECVAILRTMTAQEKVETDVMSLSEHSDYAMGMRTNLIAGRKKISGAHKILLNAVNILSEEQIVADLENIKTSCEAVSAYITDWHPKSKSSRAWSSVSIGTC